MAINKNILYSDFTQLPNKLILDTKISAKAFKIQVYLWSLPDDWAVNYTDVAKRLNISKKMVAKGLKELTTAGWITRHEQKRVKGHFSNYDYNLYETPDTVKRTTVKRNTVKRNTGMTETVNHHNDGIGVLTNTNSSTNTQGTTNTHTTNKKSKPKDEKTIERETKQTIEHYNEVYVRNIKHTQILVNRIGRVLEQCTLDDVKLVISCICMTPSLRKQYGQSGVSLMQVMEPNTFLNKLEECKGIMQSLYTNPVNEQQEAG